MAVQQPAPPALLAGWCNWTEAQHLEFVTNAQHDPHLSQDILAFFRAELFDRSLKLVTRNNMANALVGQEANDATLAAVFRTLLEDPTQEIKWRDYALQFLAASLDWSDNPSAMAAAIWEQAQRGPGTLSGTALLHLHYIDERGIRPLPHGYRERLATCLTDAAIDLPTRMSAVGIAGQRRFTTLALTICDLAENAPEPAMRRTALATLGFLGDATNLRLIRRYTTDPDPLIAAAAKGAEQRLMHAQGLSDGSDPAAPSKL